MKKYTILLVCLFCFDISQGAVYTPLDFKYIDVSNHEMVTHAQAVAAYILDSNVTYDARKKIYYVKKRKIGEKYNLCRDELFYDRISIANCTGFLISPENSCYCWSLRTQVLRQRKIWFLVVWFY